MQKKDLKRCKNLSRQIFCLLAVFLLCARLSAHSGMLMGEKKLRVAKTRWFDIIYPARCEESASILFEKADSVYDEVTAQYGLTPSFRMPVVITPVIEQFNAFWTAVPYNHIAIYDTGISGSNELAVFSETLLSTFRHELTHAVTFNMKNDFWRGAGRVFGDFASPGMFSVTTGMAEGATVTSESMAGEGRLNDEYTKHYVKQAKIEKSFPSYHDVSGASELSPNGAEYYFNGAFHQWLQEKYGMEAYADFWWRVVNGKNLTIGGAFKKAFGIKLKDAWCDFAADYEVPDIAENPVMIGQVKDFFVPEAESFSRMNDAGSLYGSLTSAGNRLVWFDRIGGRVFTVNAENSKNDSACEDFSSSPDVQVASGQSIRLLFSQRTLTGVRLSNDGRFLAASYISGNGVGEKARVRLYDFERGSFYSVREKGLKEALVVKSGDSWYLVAQKYFAQHYSIKIFLIEFSKDGKRISGIKPFSEVIFEPEINPFAFTALDADFLNQEKSGAFAYIKKNRMNYSLCISSLTGNLLKEYVFPENMVVRSLSYSGNPERGNFYFSYAQKGTLPRLGKLQFLTYEDMEPDIHLYLSSQDISGGVFEPVFWNNQIIYTGKFFRQNRILCMEEGPLELPSVDLSNTHKKDAENESKNLSLQIQQDTQFNVSQELLKNSKPYNPFPYMVRGILLPLSNYTTNHFVRETPDSSDSKDTDSSIFNNFYPGITYITSNPWSNGASDLITLTGGWNFVTDTFGTSLTINKGSSTALFNSQLQVKSEFNADGWKQGGIISVLSSSFSAGRVSSILISNTAAAFMNSSNDYLLSDIATVQYSTIKKAGPGRFENKGFAFAVNFSTKNLDEYVIGVTTKVCIPRLLPFESKYGYTTNLPFTVLAKLLPASSVYGYANYAKAHLGRPVFDAIAEITAFSFEIQRAVPVITAVYLNDFYISFGYAATGTAGSATQGGFQTSHLADYFSALADGRGYYLDSIFIKSALEFTPNIGLLADQNYKISLYTIFSYTINSAKKLNPEERIKLSLGVNMNF